MTPSSAPLIRRVMPPRPHALDPDVLVTAGHPSWEQARQPWNLAVEQRPAAVALPRSPQDVAALVEFARGRGLRVAPQATGHGASSLGSLQGSLLIKTSRMRAVQIHADARTARAEAGTLWMDVTAPASEHRLAALAGSAPDVGVIGYTLGGGLSWLARHYGLAANSVRRAEVVTADGRLLDVDAEHEPDLFWALRGGGGSYAIVTALEFELYPIAEVYAGAFFWPLEQAPKLLYAWSEWLQKIPDQVTSVGRLLRIPPTPELPPELRGRNLVAIEAACVGGREQGETLFAPLRALSPEIDTFATISPHALGRLHMDPPMPVPAFGDGMLLSELPAAAIDELLDVAGAYADSPLLCVDIRHLGGAAAGERFTAGAVLSLDAEFALFAVGIAPDGESRRLVQDHVEALQHALGRWDARRTYLNFAERPRLASDLFGELVHKRLREVKATYDPDNLIQVNHPVHPGIRDRRQRRLIGDATNAQLL